MMGRSSNQCRNTGNYFLPIVHREKKDFIEAPFCQLGDTNIKLLVGCSRCDAHKFWDIESDISFFESGTLIEAVFLIRHPFPQSSKYNRLTSNA